MHAARLIAPGTIEFADVAEPRPSAGEVLIAPLRLGICGSDVSIYQGHRQVPLPLTPGHEVVGRVAALGSEVTGFVPGQRVIVEPNYPCGICRFCRSGRGRICPDKVSMGVTAPGAAAEQVTAPANFVWAIPDTISDEDAATIEPLAVALHAVNHSWARPGETVAVVGCGAIGLLIVQVAVQIGLRVLAHDLAEEKLDLAAKLGAQRAGSEDPAALWLERGVATVFESAGVANAVETCIAAAPRGSEVVLLGLGGKPASFSPFRLVREGIRISTSLIYDHPHDFARCIELVGTGALRPSATVTHTFPLERLGSALDLAGTGNCGKIHITIGGQSAA